jgi:hypothetical protein
MGCDATDCQAIFIFEAFEHVAFVVSHFIPLLVGSIRHANNHRFPERELPMDA